MERALDHGYSTLSPNTILTRYLDATLELVDHLDLLDNSPETEGGLRSWAQGFSSIVELEQEMDNLERELQRRGLLTSPTPEGRESVGADHPED